MAVRVRRANPIAVSINAVLRSGAVAISLAAVRRIVRALCQKRSGAAVAGEGTAEGGLDVRAAQAIRVELIAVVSHMAVRVRRANPIAVSINAVLRSGAVAISIAALCRIVGALC